MNFRALFLASLMPVLFAMPVQDAFAQTCTNISYSTNFPLNENPISEGGRWTNTISRTFNAPVSTTGGHAVGLNSNGYNISVAMLTGDYGPDQTITATAYRAGYSGAADIELHLRMRMVPGSTDQLYSYEVMIAPSLGALRCSNGAVRAARWRTSKRLGSMA